VFVLEFYTLYVLDIHIGVTKFKQPLFVCQEASYRIWW